MAATGGRLLCDGRCVGIYHHNPQGESGSGAGNCSTGTQKRPAQEQVFFLSHLRKLLSECVDFASQTGLFAGCSVFMINMVSCSLIDRLASNRKEGFRFISVSSLNSVKNTTGSSAYTGLLSSVLCMALSVRFYTKNRCFDIWQVIHPP